MLTHEFVRCARTCAEARVTVSRRGTAQMMDLHMQFVMRGIFAGIGRKRAPCLRKVAMLARERAGITHPQLFIALIGIIHRRGTARCARNTYGARRAPAVLPGPAAFTMFYVTA